MARFQFVKISLFPNLTPTKLYRASFRTIRHPLILMQNLEETLVHTRRLLRIELLLAQLLLVEHLRIRIQP